MKIEIEKKKKKLAVFFSELKFKEKKFPFNFKKNKKNPSRLDISLAEF